LPRGAIVGYVEPEEPNPDMKTAYELAMERLNKASPAVKVTPEKKRALADLDARYAARIAEREIALREDIARAAGAGESEKADQLRQQLAVERQSLQTELEAKKDVVRRGGA
jgi:hypothetical protein